MHTQLPASNAYNHRAITIQGYFYLCRRESLHARRWHVLCSLHLPGGIPVNLINIKMHALRLPVFSETRVDSQNTLEWIPNSREVTANMRTQVVARESVEANSPDI